MASNTARMGFRKVTYTDPESVVPDVDNNLQIIDDAINANLFTSSSRPVNPHVGRLIYETDTKLIAIYLGSPVGWEYVGGDGFARGKKALVQSDVDSATTTTVEIGPYISVTFTAEVNRRYWVETIFNTSFTGAGNGATAQPRVRWAVGGTVTTAGTQLGSDVIDNMVYGANNAQDFFHQFELVPNINGSITVGLFIFGTSAAKNYFFDQSTDRSAFLIARDVGSL